MHFNLFFSMYSLTNWEMYFFFNGCPTIANKKWMIEQTSFQNDLVNLYSVHLNDAILHLCYEFDDAKQKTSNLLYRTSNTNYELSKYMDTYKYRLSFSWHFYPKQLTFIHCRSSYREQLSVLLKDASTRAGIEPPTPWLKDGSANHWHTYSMVEC